MNSSIHHPLCQDSCCVSGSPKHRVWKTQAAMQSESSSFTGRFHALIDEEEEFDDEQCDNQLASLTSLNEITQNNIKNSKRAYGKQKIAVIRDSGAADCVIPEALVSSVPTNINTEGPKMAVDGSKMVPRWS